MGSNPEGITRAARGAAHTSGWFYENTRHPGSVGGFRSVRQRASIEGDVVTLTAETADVLRVKTGDTVRVKT
jgi:arginine/ornithine N-succinyltransferase beta subunit